MSETEKNPWIEELKTLEQSGNFRKLPEGTANLTDFTSNDYLGLGHDASLREQFLAFHDPKELLWTSSASRLLAEHQSVYNALERALEKAYHPYFSDKGHRSALLFNSGYHANTGIIQAVGKHCSLILADRLVHASVIDGLRLCDTPFTRFRHNDFDHLEKLLSRRRTQASATTPVLVVVESVYSMDGDKADLKRLAEIKRIYPEVMLYVDEAHAIGAEGPQGLGVSVEAEVAGEIDILVGTFGKALASAGAFALTSPTIRDYLINKARSLIFSTALSPAQTLWTLFMWNVMLEADDARQSLKNKARKLAEIIPGGEPSHIRPLVVGDASKAVELSAKLREEGFNVLPIRTPTVPPGTERLRFSLSAAIPDSEIARLGAVMHQFIGNEK